MRRNPASTNRAGRGDVNERRRRATTRLGPLLYRQGRGKCIASRCGLRLHSILNGLSGQRDGALSFRGVAISGVAIRTKTGRETGGVQRERLGADPIYGLTA